MTQISSEAKGYFGTLFNLMVSLRVSSPSRQEQTLDEAVEEALQIILSVQAQSGKVMLIGNGGSSAIVSHMQNDLCAAVGVKAMVFHDPALMTALSNDHGYGCVFENQVDLWAEKDDLLIAVSSSGRSENILRAVAIARERGCRIITFSGFDENNPLRQNGDLNFYVPARGYGLVELAHSILAHYLTDYTSLRQAQSRQHSVRIVSFEDEFEALSANGHSNIEAHTS